jgi:hypothetical protein
MGEQSKPAKMTAEDRASADAEIMARIDAKIAAHVAQAPPLTAEQKARVRLLLHPPARER